MPGRALGMSFCVGGVDFREREREREREGQEVGGDGGGFILHFVLLEVFGRWWGLTTI